MSCKLATPPDRKYGGLEVNKAKRLKELEQKNSRLKRMVANLMLENEAVKEVLKIFKAQPASRDGGAISKKN